MNNSEQLPVSQENAEANEQTPKKKEKKRHSLLFRAVRYILFILIVSAALSYIAVTWSNDLLALAKPDKEITVEIPVNASTGEVAKILDNAEVINKRMAFRLFVGVMGRNQEIRFRPGEYTLNSNMDYRGLIATMRYAEGDTFELTIPAGTVAEIREVITGSGLCTEKDWDEAMKQGGFTGAYLPADMTDPSVQLEGYLYPDTYDFDLNTDAHGIIQRMISRFDKKTESDRKRQSIVSACAEQGISVSDAVIVASIVQKEALRDKDMKMVASVIWNRLNAPDEFPTLQLPSTLAYVVGHGAPFSEAELANESPYNTYVAAGLPAGPICNPSYAALYAAVHPDDTGFLYFAPKKDGKGSAFSENALPE